MNNKREIYHRAERCKCQYPKDKYVTAHLALCGDGVAENEFMERVYRTRPSVWSRIKAAWQALTQ